MWIPRSATPAKNKRLWLHDQLFCYEITRKVSVKCVLSPRIRENNSFNTWKTRTTLSGYKVTDTADNNYEEVVKITINLSKLTESVISYCFSK